MAEVNLPILNCDDCGACCMSMGAPPGYTGQEMIIFLDAEDESRFEAMPQEARDAIYAWADRIEAIPDGGLLPDSEPCCWLDMETRRCKWYEWRPSVCREFGVGSKYCLEWREYYEID